MHMMSSMQWSSFGKWLGLRQRQDTTVCYSSRISGLNGMDWQKNKARPNDPSGKRAAFTLKLGGLFDIGAADTIDEIMKSRLLLAFFSVRG